MGFTMWMFVTLQHERGDVGNGNERYTASAIARRADRLDIHAGRALPRHAAVQW